MKKLFLLIIFIGNIISVNAQKNVIVDTFDDNSYGWSEAGNKKAMSYVSDGCLNLSSKKGVVCSSAAQLPINYNEDFKVTFKIKLKKRPVVSSFDILFDVREDGSFNSIGVFMGKQCNIIVKGHESEYFKFNFTKTLDYEIQIIKKGRKLELLINGMDMNSYDNIQFGSNNFAVLFSSISSSVLSVEEIVIEQ